MKYWTIFEGVGGKIEGEEDFVVEEVPSAKFFKKFARSGSGVKTVDGPYALFLLKKRGMTTRNAVDFIQAKFHLKKDDIGYAGLKDKFAITSQYLTIKGNVADFISDKIELKKIGSTDKMMQVGELEGNRFNITLRNCTHPENAGKITCDLTSRGLPNYFGSQRFGACGDNHEIGRLILKGSFDKAAEIINNHGGAYDKKTTKFYIHAYQSFLFNRMLDLYISKNKKPFFGEFPIVGCDTKLAGKTGATLRKFLKEDGIQLKDFSVRELNIKCGGSRRAAFVHVKNITYETVGKNVLLEFELPKGSYATVLINELTKLEV